jgi:hypothetical protein
METRGPALRGPASLRLCLSHAALLHLAPPSEPKDFYRAAQEHQGIPGFCSALYDEFPALLPSGPGADAFRALLRALDPAHTLSARWDAAKETP